MATRTLTATREVPGSYTLTDPNGNSRGSITGSEHHTGGRRRYWIVRLDDLTDQHFTLRDARAWAGA